MWRIPPRASDGAGDESSVHCKLPPGLWACGESHPGPVTGQETDRRDSSAVTTEREGLQDFSQAQVLALISIVVKQCCS
ncbi:hypothetical protein ACOMHN_033131 [Nucella lapillus]